MTATYTLVSAVPGDQVPGTEISDPESPIGWHDLPLTAQQWAEEQGYGDDAELLYVLTGDDEAPEGFPVYRVHDPDNQPEYHTAWVTTDPTAVAGEHADVVVLVDDVTIDAGEIVHRESTGVEAMGAVELPTRMDEDSGTVLVEAEQALAEAGWQVEGSWEAVPTGCTASVRR